MNEQQASEIISIRLSRRALDKIDRAIEAQHNQDVSRVSYCKRTVIRHLFRHDKDYADIVKEELRYL